MLTSHTLATVCAAGGRRTFRVLELASKFSSRSELEKNKTLNSANLEGQKCHQTYARVEKSVGEQLPTVINEALNVLIMVHVVRVEFLANAIQ